MKKITQILGGLLLWGSVGTTLALLLLLGFLLVRGTLTTDAIRRASNALGGGPEETGPPPPPRDPTIEEIDRAVSARWRNLEQREMALRNQRDELLFEQSRLSEDREKFLRLQAQFDQRLADLTTGAKARNLEVVRQIFEGMEPTQAKDQILRMVKAQETEAVIRLLAEMPATRRAPILDEFRGEEDGVILAELLRRLREGEPESKLVQDTQAVPPTSGAP